MTIKSKKTIRTMRHKRIRKKIFGNSERPRLSVFRSNKYIYAQIINDENGSTLTPASDQALDSKSNIINAENVGASIAKNAKALGIKKVVFDKSGYAYTGRIQALADAARKGGLIF